MRATRNLFTLVSTTRASFLHDGGGMVHSGNEYAGSQNAFFRFSDVWLDKFTVTTTALLSHPHYIGYSSRATHIINLWLSTVLQYCILVYSESLGRISSCWRNILHCLLEYIECLPVGFLFYSRLILSLMPPVINIGLWGCQINKKLRFQHHFAMTPTGLGNTQNTYISKTGGRFFFYIYCTFLTARNVRCSITWKT